MDLCIPVFFYQLFRFEVFACPAVEVAPFLLTGIVEAYVIILAIYLTVREIIVIGSILSGVHLTSPPL